VGAVEEKHKKYKGKLGLKTIMKRKMKEDFFSFSNSQTLYWRLNMLKQ
jgi:hypothetical protein